MGTSKSYNMPSGGDWNPLKRSATAFVTRRAVGTSAMAELLRNYVRAKGGSRNFSGLAGGGGSGSAGGSPATTTAQGLGSFLSSVASSNLEEALTAVGLEDLIGEPVADLIAAILELIAGPASTLEIAAARDALGEVVEELFENATTPDEVEEAIRSAVDGEGLASILHSFFTNYLYAQFCRDFYETWQKKEGADKAAQSLSEVRDYMDAAVIERSGDFKVDSVDWFGVAGATLCEGIMRDTVSIFEVTE
jgi:hypothetical protein